VLLLLLNGHYASITLLSHRVHWITDIPWVTDTVSECAHVRHIHDAAIIFLNTTHLHDFVVCDNFVTIIYAYFDDYCNSHLFVPNAVQWFTVYRIDNVINELFVNNCT